MPLSTVVPTVHFHFSQTSIPLGKRRLLKQFLIGQFETYRIPLQRLDYIFCSDDYLLDLNIRMLEHNYLTDIITFPLHKEGDPVISEIYISLDRVKDNALTFKVKPQMELLRVIFHGALHLLGYSDTTSALKTQIRVLEDQWLEEWVRFHVERS